VRRLLAIATIALAGAVVGAGTAAADPVQPPKTFQFALTCTGLGEVLGTNIGPASTRAFHVVGTNTILLVPLDDTPGLESQALAAGTTCTITAAGLPGALEPVEPPLTLPVVIVNG
jgi:hypothetical protein